MIIPFNDCRIGRYIKYLGIFGDTLCRFINIEPICEKDLT